MCALDCDCQAHPVSFSLTHLERLMVGKNLSHYKILNELGRGDIAALRADCEIDHSIGPVLHTPGGSLAGYDRWEEFRTHGLTEYALLRNRATVRPPKGASRVSPYLHHGHVSPFRIAREAAADGSEGAKKYLAEPFVWPEIAFNPFFNNSDPGTLHALPVWAWEAIAKHDSDKRHTVYSWERLARGDKGDPLWDAAQHSLRIHGELRNNVRMTWGKAFLNWTNNPEEALRLIIDLNHRFALDRSDPNSYRGIVWCFGLFDRPFFPEIPIYGTVRPRPTEAHSQRLDLKRCTQHVSRPARSERLSIAVIGAGLSGLSAARTLADHGLEVQVFDKARGPGGRMATRYSDAYAFDHGAQYFTARDERFKQYVQAWINEGLVEKWECRLAVARSGELTSKTCENPLFVGVPRMSTVTRHLSNGLDVRYQTRIARTIRIDENWCLFDEEHMNLGSFDVLLVTTPPNQAAPLLIDIPGIVRQIESVSMVPCWSLMAVFNEPLSLEYDGLFVEESPISWAARNNSKPGRPMQETWILHGSHAWSEENLEAEKEAVMHRMLSSFFEAAGLHPVDPHILQAHRWRYALAQNQLDVGCIWNTEMRVGVCGDWCLSRRVEGAFLSGMAAAGRVLGLPNRGATGAEDSQAALF